MLEQSYSASTLNQNHCKLSTPFQAGLRACGQGRERATGKQTFNFIKGAKFLKVSLASREIKCKQVERAFSVLAK